MQTVFYSDPVVNVSGWTNPSYAADDSSDELPPYYMEPNAALTYISTNSGSGTYYRYLRANGWKHKSGDAFKSVGKITKVEIGTKHRADENSGSWKGNGASWQDLQPEFGGETPGTLVRMYYADAHTSIAKRTVYQEITTDDEAPTVWRARNIENLDVTAIQALGTHINGDSYWYVYLYTFYLRVTWEEGVNNIFWMGRSF